MSADFASQLPNHFPCRRVATMLGRRDWLRRAGGGAGLIALANLLGEQRLLGNEYAKSQEIDSLVPRSGHFAAKAKAVIWLFMEGAPSAVDLFDPKPELTRRNGQTTDIKAFFGNPGPLMKSPFDFKQYGACGQWVCEHYTNVAKHVDKLAFIKSCYSESNDHVPAIYQINSGLPRPGFPTAGAWITYGLGSENQNLPGYVVLGNTKGAKGGPHNWGSGFLPSTYQGTLFRSEGSPILNLKRQPRVMEHDQRAAVGLDGQARMVNISNGTLMMEISRAGCSRLNWRFACRPKRPMSSICRRSQPKRTLCTESIIRHPSPMARSA